MPCSRYVNDNMLQLLMINNLLHLQMQILFHGKGGSCVFEGCTTQSYLFTLGFPCRKGEFMNIPTRHYPRTCRVLKGSIMQKIVFTFLSNTGVHTNVYQPVIWNTDLNPNPNRPILTGSNSFTLLFIICIPCQSSLVNCALL
jgi:hypothetical protein